MPWPSPALTAKEAQTLAQLMGPDITTQQVAALLQTNDAQADAFRRYVILVCVLNKRRRRAIPCDKVEGQARTLLRCMSPAMRNQLPEALRWGI